MPTLSAADHEHFIEHGYVVLRAAVPHDTIEVAVEYLEAHPDDRGRQTDVVSACTTERMLDGIAELFGAPTYTLARRSGGNNMPRPYQPDGEWVEPVAHVDDSYPTTMPNGWAVGSFIFLTKVRPRGGAFVVFPGSYLRYRQQLAASCHCIKGAAAMVENSGEGQPFLAEPGDVLLFHHLTGHTGSDNLADPVTRHALLSRWYPEQRIVPGAKPFDHMTTIEKANSARYLADRFDLPSPVTPQATASTTLADGLDLGADIRAHAILHHGGRFHLLATSESDTTRLRHWVSEAGLDWSELEHVRTTEDPITGIQFHQYDLDVILAVTDEAGSTQLSSSNDLQSWLVFARRSENLVMTPWFVYANYPSKVAGGRALFEVKTQQPSRLVCRWGDHWQDVAEWETDSEALFAEDQATIEDVTIAAHVGDSTCTFVVDLLHGGESSPYYVQPVDVAVAMESLQPLPFSTPTTPSRLRLVNRSRNYWLVTYLRTASAGRRRLFWGFIDWSDPTPTLEELSTPAALEEAQAIVGFI
ncbi:MAG: phytanoyl-CoA dioxygenase family protein [Candidatus Latescibacterota bacterium]|nr:phytanoyl-CoA dioxygenase family protein [Candidatus Latescibacterota bacterium]